MNPNTSLMHYEYSTKNFHRYSSQAGTIKEVYVPRAEMDKPLSGINVSVNAAVGATIVAEKSKPARS